jgi:hypothetical protein
MENKSILENLTALDVDFTNQKSIRSLEKRIEVLGDICNELNPYAPISAEFKLKLREFNILDASDPFHVTNALLRLLEDSINELHVLKPLSAEEMQIENLR